MGRKFTDLTGQIFGHLKVIEKDESKKRCFWLCKCDCGNKQLISVSSSNLRSGGTSHCGCSNKRVVDLTGQRFGKLTVIKREGSDKFGNSTWLCKCDCNENEKVYSSVGLKSLHTKSCGCLASETTSARNKIINKKYNKYDLSGEYGIGYTEEEEEEFYFDLEDYEKIRDYYWAITNGYVITSNDVIGNVLMHRLIMNIRDEQIKVDHIYHKTYDNRKSQLRIVTNSQNGMNSVIAKNNTSGVTGVGWHKKREYWYASIGVNNKSIYLGQFKKFEDAVKARKEAEEKYFGEYSYDNSMKLDNQD